RCRCLGLLFTRSITPAAYRYSPCYCDRRRCSSLARLRAIHAAGGSLLTATAAPRDHHHPQFPSPGRPSLWFRPRYSRRLAAKSGGGGGVCCVANSTAVTAT
ncbi:unnamed protein product, partial [Ectocarpus sp. 12 AP-2014]